MARQGVGKRILPELPREQFLIHLYGYLAQNGCTELARVLAKEARFAANHYPLLDYFGEWWAQMWPMCEEFLARKSSMAPFEPNSMYSPALVPPAAVNRQFKVPVTYRDAALDTAAARGIQQPQFPHQKPMNTFQGHSSPALNALHPEIHPSAMWGQIGEDHPIDVPLRDNIPAGMHQQLLFDQQKLQFLEARQHTMPQDPAQLLPHAVLPRMANAQMPNQYANHGVDASLTPPLRRASVPKPARKLQKKPVVPNKPKPLLRGPQIQKVQKQALHLPLQEVIFDSSRAALVDLLLVGKRLRSQLPILLPGQEPLRVRKANHMRGERFTL